MASLKSNKRRVKSNKKQVGHYSDLGMGGKTRKTANMKAGKARQPKESGTGPKSQGSRTAKTLGKMTKAMSRAKSLRELAKMAKQARKTAGIGGNKGRNSHWGKKISAAQKKAQSRLNKAKAKKNRKPKSKRRNHGHSSDRALGGSSKGVGRSMRKRKHRRRGG